MTQLWTEAVNVVGEIERQDVSDLLNHVAVLHQASNAFLAKLEHASQNCLAPSNAMMELSHKVRDSLSVILCSAWMLEMHGDNLDASQLSRHCSMIRERILRLLNEFEVAVQWQELDLNLQLLPVNFENFVSRRK